MTSAPTTYVFVNLTSFSFHLAVCTAVVLTTDMWEGQKYPSARLPSVGPVQVFQSGWCYASILFRPNVITCGDRQTGGTNRCGNSWAAGTPGRPSGGDRVNDCLYFYDARLMPCPWGCIATAGHAVASFQNLRLECPVPKKG